MTESDCHPEYAEAKAALQETVESFGEGALRDLWVFDSDTQEALYLRDDVQAELEDANVDRYIDNERYGFVTRDTYQALHYADFYYTVRGFDAFEQYRTFLADDDDRVGVLCSFDRREGGYDFADLTERLTALTTEHAVAGLLPG